MGSSQRPQRKGGPFRDLSRFCGVRSLFCSSLPGLALSLSLRFFLFFSSFCSAVCSLFLWGGVVLRCLCSVSLLFGSVLFPWSFVLFCLLFPFPFASLFSLFLSSLRSVFYCVALFFYGVAVLFCSCSAGLPFFFFLVDWTCLFLFLCLLLFLFPAAFISSVPLPCCFLYTCRK